MYSFINAGERLESDAVRVDQPQLLLTKEEPTVQTRVCVRASPASTDSASPHAYLVGLPAAEETRSLKLNGCQMDWTVCGGLAAATWLQLGTAGIGPRMWRVRIDDP